MRLHKMPCSTVFVRNRDFSEQAAHLSSLLPLTVSRRPFNKSWRNVLILFEPCCPSCSMRRLGLTRRAPSNNPVPRRRLERVSVLPVQTPTGLGTACQGTSEGTKVAARQADAAVNTMETKVDTAWRLGNGALYGFCANAAG